MKIKSLFLFFLFNYSLHLISFSQSWQWATTGGGGYSDKATDIDIDPSGNLYVSGYYNVGQPADILVNFGSIATQTISYTGWGDNWGKEGFIAQTNPTGTWTWVNSAIGGWDERVLGTHVDKIHGYVYVTGTTWNELDTIGNCSLFGGTADEMFLVKFDFNGNCQWAINGGTYGDDHGYDMVTDKLGNIYLTGFMSDHYGNFGDTGYFGNITVPMTTDSIAFLTKISSSGVFQWVRTFEAIDGERDNGIAIDSLSNVYVTGGFWGTKKLGSKIVTSKGGQDIFVVKYDSSGNQLWLKTTGSTLDDRGNGITVDQFNNIFVTGEFRDTVSFGTDKLNNYGGPGGRDIFVARIRTDGTWVWAKKAGSSSGGDRGDKIITNKKGNIFITGQFSDTAKFGGNILLENANGLQVFVAAIDTLGKWRWALQAGSVSDDRGTGITCDDSCNIYVSGYYEQTALFGNIGLTSTGAKDAFVAGISNACFDYTVTSTPNSAINCGIYVPTAFSPNDDGKNDLECVMGSCIQALDFIIYDRWGQKVFETIDPNICWDGMFNGAFLNTNVFMYYLNADLTNGTQIVKKGTVLLNK